MEFYCNPINTSDDIPDPFVLRHNGKYYLYFTNPDICCWSSDNLVEWRREGPTIAEDVFPAQVPFAPEVVYWNGLFYMYTSPHGLGHYVLKSENATGPFHAVTGNVGHNIDGSVFIDDDGKWYFYWANDSGILGCEMKSPVEFGEPVHTGAFMEGWTEGPLVVKENGKYYMTFTGNHYLSKGYRINAAISDHPLTGYVDCVHNPVVIHTEGPFFGLGHSSTVYGPDMFTRYIVYHNLNPDKTRNLNIDAIILDEDVRVLGPTNYPQPSPKSADFFDNMISGNHPKSWELLKGSCTVCGNFLVSSGNLHYVCENPLYSDSGVVEFNLFIKDGEDGEGSYGVEIGFYRVVMSPASNRIRILQTDGLLLNEYVIPYPYQHNALHALQIRYSTEEASLYVDGRKTTECKMLIRSGDRIGYFSEGPKVAMGYTAFSAGNMQTAAAGLFVPLPCTVPLSGRKNEKIRLNVAESGEYIVAIACKEANQAQNLLTVELDEGQVGCKPIAMSRDIVLYVVRLPQGLQEVSLTFGHGQERPAVLFIHSRSSDAFVSEKITDFGPYDKRCWGGTDCPCFEAVLELDDFPKIENSSVGILFRGSELADGGEGDDKKLGINFFIGYCVSLENGRVVLTKHRYNEKELLFKNINLGNASNYRLRLRVEVNDICVYVGDNPEPVLEYHDSCPILFGATGIRIKNYRITEARFDKYSIESNKTTASSFYEF